jgi:hypothetical protein
MAAKRMCTTFAGPRLFHLRESDSRLFRLAERREFQHDYLTCIESKIAPGTKDGVQ